MEEALGQAGTGQDTTTLPGDRQQQLRGALSTLTSCLFPGSVPSVPPGHHTAQEAEPGCILLGAFTLKPNEDLEPSAAEPCSSIPVPPAATQGWDVWQGLQCLSCCCQCPWEGW